jgi:hypothetical protein
VQHFNQTNNKNLCILSFYQFSRSSGASVNDASNQEDIRKVNGILNQAATNL